VALGLSLPSPSYHGELRSAAGKLKHAAPQCAIIFVVVFNHL
jgi:hypothetical protein